MAFCGCGCGNSRRRREIVTEMTTSLSQVEFAFPHTQYACILKRNGDLIAESFIDIEPGVMPSSLSPDILIPLVQVSADFARTLGEAQCPAMHVKGADGSLISILSINSDHVMAFQTNLTSSEAAIFDTAAADLQLAPVVERIQQHLLTLKS
eukprot:gnl/Dysnectes_brevis/4805_a6635_944.p1 GENE.gnl/Dysnectes_brevis/4805_a6635_944~~gnl/Dysnectes_brevis/4805_a6635_944.p1  ORF type:complete len:152 (-),score=24.22 gnl/Dysnectes_brevis/4805_a6635_944:57-512(-)